MRALIDRYMGKFVSRKLAVFVVATVLMYMQFIESETWGTLAVVYIGGQAAVDAVLAWRHGR